jgi:sugar lactone lactonase YvrE
MAQRKFRQTVAMCLAVAAPAAGLLGLTAAPAWGAAAPGVYWANAGLYAIGHADLDGAGVEQEAVTGINFPRGVALDREHVYWANSVTRSIGRADLDGANVEGEFIRGLDTPRGVAVDGAHVYWTNSLGNSIGRANLDGSRVENDFILTGIGIAGRPVGIAVDAGHVYWTCPGSGTGAGLIGRADLDGSEIEESFITGATSPEGVAVDGAHVYWTNTTDATIGRANLDGTDADQDFITGAAGPVGIAVDARHVYWANNDLDEGDPDTIGRADLDGASVDQSFITGVHNPLGVALMPVTRVTLPASLEFGSQTVGDAGGLESVTVENSGRLPLRVAAAGIVGPDAADFTIAAGSDGCSGAPVAPGRSCTIAVRFKPHLAGPRAATLTLTDNAQDGAQAVSLTGVGVAPSSPPAPPHPPVPSHPRGPSPPTKLPAPPGADAKVTVHFASGTARHGRVRLRLRCSGAPRCRGKIRLLMSVRPDRRGAARRARAARGLPAGQRAFAVRKGRRTIAVRLNRRARRALRRRGHLRLTARVTVRGGGRVARAARTVSQGH